MVRSSVFVAALAGLLSSPLSAPAQQPASAPKVLVFPFAALGDDTRVNADLLRKNLINSIDALAEVDSVDPAKAEATLGKPLAEARDACAEDDACTSALVRAVGARFLVKGGVLVDASGYTLTLQLFDADAGRIVKGPETQRVANEDKGVASMRVAAAWLFATTGTLVVDCPVAADVFIDSRPLGKRTPGDRAVNIPVRLGKVSIRLEAAGHHPFETTVEVFPGRPTMLKADLKKKDQPVATRTPVPVKTTPLTRKPMFWGAVAAGVAVVGAGVAVAASQGGGTNKKTEYDDQDSDLPPGTAIDTW
jgi:TolB-like protein